MVTQLAVQAGMLLAKGGDGHDLIDQCKGSIKAPGNLGDSFDLILSWVRWGSLAILSLAFFAAIGMMVWGRVTYHPRGARIGFDALVICLVAAIIYVAGFSLITGIAKGC